MTENEELKKRIEVLEKKVELLEKAFEAIGNVNRSKELEETIEGYSRALKLVELLDSADNSTNKAFDVDAFQRKYEESVEEKRAIDRKIEIDKQIRAAAAAQENVNVDDFSYEISGDNAVITSYNGFECRKLIVPNSIQGFNVTKIGANAFEGLEVESVLLPSSIRVIEKFAFSSCKNLSEINLPDYLGTLEKGCFSNTALKEISLPYRITRINRQCFMECSNLTKVYMPEGLAEISSYSFSGTAITSIVFPKSLYSLDVKAFSDFDLKYVPLKKVVFLGNHTKVDDSRDKRRNAFPNDCIIYCNPGSEMQKYARKHGYIVKPLSEFDFSQIE